MGVRYVRMIYFLSERLSCHLQQARTGFKTNPYLVKKQPSASNKISHCELLLCRAIFFHRFSNVVHYLSSKSLPKPDNNQ